MTPIRLLALGFLAIAGLAALDAFVHPAARLPLRARLNEALKRAGETALMFALTAYMFGAVLTPTVGCLASSVGYERRREQDERQHRALSRLVELDETLAEPPIRGDPEAREEQEERIAKAAKERARVWKRFTKANRVKILPDWLVRAEDYVLAAGPLLLFAWGWWKRDEG